MRLARAWDGFARAHNVAVRERVSVSASLWARAEWLAEYRAARAGRRQDRGDVSGRPEFAAGVAEMRRRIAVLQDEDFALLGLEMAGEDESGGADYSAEAETDEYMECVFGITPGNITGFLPDDAEIRDTLENAVAEPAVWAGDDIPF